MDFLISILHEELSKTKYIIYMTLDNLILYYVFPFNILVFFKSYYYKKYNKIIAI